MYHPPCRRTLVNLVWALSLDVSWLLALIASALAGGLRWAVTAQVANLSAVVALLALRAVARHVAVTSAGVAGLSTLVSAVSTSTSTTTVALVETSSGLVSTSLWAVTGDVADLRALVALLASTLRVSGWSTSSSLSSWVGAVTGNVTWLTALVAGLVLWSLWALTAHMTLATAVVALSWATGWAITGLVRSIAAVVASTGLGGSTVLHFEDLVV